MRNVKDESRMMKDDDFKLKGFEDRQTDRQTDIGDCRVTFATERASKSSLYISNHISVYLILYMVFMLPSTVICHSIPLIFC